MLNDKFTKELMDKLTYALKGSGILPQYVYNEIEPVIEKYVAQQSASVSIPCVICGGSQENHNDDDHEYRGV